MSIRWEEVEPQKYEDMVSVLLSRLHPDSQRIDGKGGDGGRDVQIVDGQDGQVRHAFELKSFTGRMKAGRRRQVADSLKRAAALKPAQWTLIVPIDPTPGEDGWFRQIGTECCLPTRWLGKTWLDGKMSAFPDIRRYFLENANDEVVRLLRELQKEEAKVTDVPVAVGRIRTLRERLNEIDPYYRYEISTGSTAEDIRPPDVVLSVNYGDVRVDVYPKYLGAVKDRPITIDVKVIVGPDNEVIQNAMDYGLGVNIPPQLVSNISVDAPAGLGGNFTGGEIDILSTCRKLDETVTLALDVLDGERLLASCPIHLTQQTSGLKGSIVNGTDTSGWLEARLTVNAADRKFAITFQLSPRPVLPSALVPLCRWLSASQPSRDLAIRWPSGLEIRSEILTSSSVDEGFSEVVEALAYLQDSSGIYREVQPSLITESGQEIVMAATLMKGESVGFTWKFLDLGLSRWGPALEELLNGRPQQFICEQDRCLELEGATIPIGRVRTQFESARLADTVGVRRALESGSVPLLRLVPGESNNATQVMAS